MTYQEFAKKLIQWEGEVGQYFIMDDKTKHQYIMNIIDICNGENLDKYDENKKELIIKLAKVKYYYVLQLLDSDGIKLPDELILGSQVEIFKDLFEK